jgi:hypothetical protein
VTTEDLGERGKGWERRGRGKAKDKGKGKGKGNIENETACR